MSRYAKDTMVSVEKSKAEIEATLARYGATEFASGWKQGQAAIGFQLHARFIKFTLPLPDAAAKEFTHTPARQNRRGHQEAHKAWEKACRQRWRALALCIKAKLEACESGITTFEDEFLAHMVMRNGSTVGQWIRPQIEEVLETGRMPPLLEDLR